jgi:hypothetical protein
MPQGLIARLVKHKATRAAATRALGIFPSSSNQGVGYVNTFSNSLLNGTRHTAPVASHTLSKFEKVSHSQTEKICRLPRGGFWGCSFDLCKHRLKSRHLADSLIVVLRGEPEDHLH